MSAFTEDLDNAITLTEDVLANFSRFPGMAPSVTPYQRSTIITKLCDVAGELRKVKLLIHPDQTDEPEGELDMKGFVQRAEAAKG